MFTRAISLAILVAGASIAAAAQEAAPLSPPFFVDLTRIANTAIEDDGIADNGQGGWTDEGVNDMLIYPPVATGVVTRNGYLFNLPASMTKGGRAVLMLKGANRAKDKPAEAVVEVPSVKAHYLYVLQNAAAQVTPVPKDYLVATYTVHYKDGSTCDIPVRDGLEIRQWWTGQWWDNAGRASWPFFMGRNLYSQKWNRYIGVWAMQWANPKPDQPITSLTFRSEEKAVPVIWAVTLADEDFYEPETRRKQDFKRPDGVPADYFTAKSNQERQAVLAESIKQGLLTGVRSAALIRPDLLAVTVDSALGGIGPGDGAGVIEGFQKPETFSVRSATDPAFKDGVRPVRVGRQTAEAWRGDIGPFPANTLFLHTFYLQLPTPVRSGNTYLIAVRGLEEGFETGVELAYDAKATTTPALKINQASFAGKARQRYAYLGWWAADLGKVDYSDCKTFEAVDEGTGKSVLQGEIRLRRAADPSSGEDVYELDLGGLSHEGRYHLLVPGLGRSDTFQISRAGERQLYVDTLRAFFHQRCGQELKAPWTTFVRPACHLQTYESGYLVGNPSYVPKPGEAVKTFRGGYHDAGDDDCFSMHLRATAQYLAVVEQYPDAFKDGDLNLPESGNKIPDILDEAAWALSFYIDNQQADGGVPAGRGNDQDAIRDWEKEHKSRPAFGNFPPTRTSSSEFAAVAAQYARLIARYDAPQAARFTEAAARAYHWVKAQPADPKSAEGDRPFLAWAAAELFSTTGAAEYHDDVHSMHTAGAYDRVHWKLGGMLPLFQWPYACCRRPEVDPVLQKAFRTAIIRRADGTITNTLASTYRMGHDGHSALGWGNGNGGGAYADVCLRAYWLTGKADYLDVASLNADFQLGANPLSKTFITGIGARHPVQPEVSETLYTLPRRSGETVKGITVYGLATGQPPGYPTEVPLYRHWRDIGMTAEVSSEFTITETVGASAMLYAALYAEDSAPPVRPTTAPAQGGTP